MKRRTWSSGPVRIEVVVDTDADPAKLPATIGNEQIGERPTSTLERREHREVTLRLDGAPSNLLSKRQLLLVPGLLALIWWRVWGLGDWAGLVLAVAIPATLFYVVAALLARRDQH